MNKCAVCDHKLSWYETKYCSNRCQSKDRYLKYIEEWKLGQKSGGIGINARSISKHLRRYLLEKYEDKCSLCGWNKRHPVTKVVPLEVDHIDGNAENNTEKNLRLICPNCHSLSPNFRNLNKGRGRTWRNTKRKQHDQSSKN